MKSNIANRNISLILAVASFCGLVYIAIAYFKGDVKLIPLCSITISTCAFLKMYLAYRKAVKNGNIYGKVTPFR